MTVPNTSSRSTPQLTDGTRRIWTFGFRVLDAGHIYLERTNLSTGVVDEITGGFAVTGVGNNQGGTVEYPVSPAAVLPTGSIITVVRRVPLGQPVRIGNQGGFFPETHETALDLLAMQIQQVHANTVSALRGPAAEGEAELLLPIIQFRQGRLLGFDANGKPIAVGDINATNAAAQHAATAQAAASSAATLAGSASDERILAQAARGGAETARDAAQSWSTLSMRWAQEADNTDVNGAGTRSAKHWAAVAQAAAGAAQGQFMPLAGGSFTGKVTTLASAAGGAGFNLPHGAAPTNPANGDFWTTTTTVSVRLGGTTREVWHSGNVPDASQAEAEAGTSTARRTFTPQRLAQAILALPGKPQAWGDITGKPTTFPPSAHVHDAASSSVAGFMSAADKAKLDTILANAQGLIFTQGGTGAVTRNAQEKWREIIDVVDYGASYGPVADQGAALQLALDYVSGRGGGAVRVTGRLSVARNINVWQSCGIIGGDVTPGGFTNGGAINWIAAFSPAIVLTRGFTITLYGAGHLRGLMIVAPNMTINQSVAEINAWGGTAITLKDFTGDQVIDRCGVFGYEYFVRKERLGGALNRCRIMDNNFDCWHGVDIDTAVDVVYVERNHGWPFCSENTVDPSPPGSKTYPAAVRPGTAFYFGTGMDWPHVNFNFSYGYLRGHWFDGTHAPVCIGGGADYVPERSDETRGLLIGSGADWPVIIAFEAAAQKHSIELAATTGLALLYGCAAWGFDVSGVFVSSGTGTRIIRDFQGVNSQAPNHLGAIIIGSAAQGHVVMERPFAENCVALLWKDPASTATHELIDPLWSGTTPRPTAHMYPSIASAATITIPAKIRRVIITGTAGIGTIVQAGADVGDELELILTSGLTLFHSLNVNGINLGNADRAMGAQTVIRLLRNTANSWTILRANGA